MTSYWKTFRNLSSLLRNLNYLSLLNSFLFLSRFPVSLKSLDNYFFRWFTYKSLLSRFSVLISYNMCSSNHFSISSCFPCFSGSRFFRVQVFQGPGSGSRVQGSGPGSRSRVQGLGSGSESRVRVQVLEVAIIFCKREKIKNICVCFGFRSKYLISSEANNKSKIYHVKKRTLHTLGPTY